MKTRIKLPLLLAFVALCLGAATAQGASAAGGLDPSFGHDGIARVTLPTGSGSNSLQGFAIAPEGRVYALVGPSLVAFESDGAVAEGFGDEGMVVVDPSFPENDPVALAIDLQGRVLIAGSTRVFSPGQTDFSRAYVIRLLPDGSRDPSFGSAGEVETDFGLPPTEGQAAASVVVSSVAVDAEDRPILSGSFGKEGVSCYVSFEDAPEGFFGRLTSGGALDPTFGESGRVVLKGAGGVSSVAETATGLAVFSRPCPTPPRFESQAPFFSFFDESGGAVPGERERPLFFTYYDPEVDPRGRIVELKSPPPAAEGSLEALVRYLPSGRPDRSFGRKGRLPLRSLALRGTNGFGLDSRGGTVLWEEGGITLRRLLRSGKLDRRFGPSGRLHATGREPERIAFDAAGRIYTAAVARTKSRTVVQIARFVPGP